MNGHTRAGVKPEFWHGKRVFMTGHTGFKGSWLALWLTEMGAEVCGYALQPPTEPNHFTCVRLRERLQHNEDDIRDLSKLQAVMHGFRPDIVFHLAAQALVRPSYENPVETYSTNVMGTVNVLEAVRHCPAARVTLIITSDKCYHNAEQIWGYRETDPMGGHDPYSSSKGCAELVTQAFCTSFFQDGAQVVGSARAGNVIGGGDWARDRLMTDIVAAAMKGQKPVIRRPGAVRPWQHVLEPLAGYLQAAQWMWNKMPKTPEAWNFGPPAEDEVTVEEVANRVCRLFGFKGGLTLAPDSSRVHEAGLLKLDSTKARHQLGWRPLWDLPAALAHTVEWYRSFQTGSDPRAISLEQIACYQSCAAAIENYRKELI